MWTILLLLALNVAVSWCTCVAVGRVWHEARAFGGWLKLLAWWGAALAALGFTSVVYFFCGAALVGAGWLPITLVQQADEYSYWLVLVPAECGYLMVMLEGYRATWRHLNFACMGVSAYNAITLAHAVQDDGITRTLESVDDLFTGDHDSGGTVLRCVVGIVLVALGSGALVTAILIRHYADTAELPAQMAA